MPRLAGFTYAILVALVAPSAARAQKIPPDVRAAIGSDGTVVQLVTRWVGASQLYIGKEKPITIDRDGARGTLVSGHERVIIALAVNDARKPFRLLVLEPTKKKPGASVTIARPNKRSDSPFAVAATETPDGFAIFFQEVQNDDMTAAHTYLVTLDKQGEQVGKAREVPVPWSLADAVWNGKGFHLALFFPGDQNGMRLSMVSTTVDGAPEQHPDWASAAGFIADVHLFAGSDKIRAFYRGGGGGDRLLESDVTAIRGWGSEPPSAKSHGSLASRKAIAVSAKGKPSKVDHPR